MESKQASSLRMTNGKLIYKLFAANIDRFLPQDGKQSGKLLLLILNLPSKAQTN
jgi:hypothetical protein